MDEKISIFLSQGYEEPWIILYFIKHKLITNDQMDQLTETIQRLSQAKFREQLVSRDKKCVISGYVADECEAAHIIPYSICKSCEISNGLLLNRCLHSLFDNYLFSINPDTLTICVSDNNMDLSINKYKDIPINIPTECIPNLKTHYNIFIQKQKLVNIK